MSEIRLRPMTAQDVHAVAELIHLSTNVWYQTHGRPPIFAAGPESCGVFAEIYEDLDPGRCLLAEDIATGRLAGSCFVHPRSTHVALGIMNVHPSYFGRRVARRLLEHVIDEAEKRGVPARLVSSCLNLDSYSLYTRAGFVPVMTYQDVCVNVPANGLAQTPQGAEHVRQATLEDLSAMVALERELAGIEREADHRYFIENRRGVWHTSVFERGGQIEGFLSSIAHPGSNMLGPGVGRDQAIAAALIHAELNVNAGRSPIMLVPAHCGDLVKQLYAWGGRNTEMHVHQVHGACPEFKGVNIPTFMPETG